MAAMKVVGTMKGKPMGKNDEIAKEQRSAMPGKVLGAKPRYIEGMLVHKSITTSKVMEAVERRNTSLDNPGFCLACGEEADGCEPDARKYKCEHCYEHAVYGADEILQHLA